MNDPLSAPRDRFFYRVTYGWRGMTRRTALVDLGRPVELGMKIKFGEEWWGDDRARRRGARGHTPWLRRSVAGVTRAGDRVDDAPLETELNSVERLERCDELAGNAPGRVC